MTLPVDFKRKKSLIKNLTFGIQFGIIVYVRVRKDPTLLCNNCLEGTTGDTYGLSDHSIIGGDDTPAPPASDLRSSDADVFD